MADTRKDKDKGDICGTYAYGEGMENLKHESGEKFTHC